MTTQNNTPQKYTRKYDHILGIAYGAIAALIFTRSDLLAGNFVAILIPLLFCVLFTWVLNVFIMWTIRFVGTKIDTLAPQKTDEPIPPTWEIVTASMDRIQIYALFATLAIVGISIGIFYLQWGKDGIQITFGQTMLYLILGIILHELCHALGWITAGRVSLADIRFGIMWRHVAPYAHCKIALPVWVHRFAVALPGIVTSVLICVGLILGNFMLTLASAILTAGAAGDVAILMLMRKLDRDLLIKDHPNDVGFFIVRDHEPS